MQKKWQIRGRKDDELKKHLLALRGFKEKDLNPPNPHEILPELFALFPQIEELVQLVIKAAGKGKPIVIHGDYDADGICATAILWEALYYGLGYKNTHPFIPNRFDHGYGLSKESLEEIAQKWPQALIIAVDCGITSVKEVDIAKSMGFEVVITDHHQPGKSKPRASAILWTDKLAGAGIAWVLSQAFHYHYLNNDSDGLDLVALATIADVQSLVGFNRILVKYGLEKLNSTERVGLKELMKVSGIWGKKITPFEVGWVLAPRINASGRLKDAREALRLLVTKDKRQAFEIAAKLDTTNRERQKLTLEQYSLARQKVLSWGKLPNILWVESEEFHEGIIGLVAGKLSQEFYRPAVVLAVGGGGIKASARSVSGVNIIATLRRLEHLSNSMGGHAGAAGFSLKPEKLKEFSTELQSLGERMDQSLFFPTVKIDALVVADEITPELTKFLETLEPFGEGNPRPCFALSGATIQDFKLLGSREAHLKMRVGVGERTFTAIWFSFPQELLSQLKVGAYFDLVFSLNENHYNRKKELQFLIKDVKFKE